ncbi:transporter [Striga asiatica]|uniref:Transporter n=1 Tax=Striga asiatica TaxID=4170 RepID=A0A5A7Q3V5_STRAF|nr:transporter [Striga asiatica]
MSHQPNVKSRSGPFESSSSKCFQLSPACSHSAILVSSSIANRKAQDVFDTEVRQLLHFHVARHTISAQAVGGFLNLNLTIFKLSYYCTSNAILSVVMQNLPWKLHLLFQLMLQHNC